jgi:hypothetical protein
MQINQPSYIRAKQVEAMKNLPREKIIITLKNGKEVEGVSFETTPIEIAKKNLPRSIVPDLVVAKVLYILILDQIY